MSLPQSWPMREHSSRAITRVAPPAVRSARVAVPSVIFVTRLAFVVVGLGPFHTVASNRSRHTGPANTASGPHVLTAFAALVTSATARATIVTFRIAFLLLIWERAHRNACARRTEAPNVGAKRFRNAGLVGVIRRERRDRVAIGLPPGWRNANSLDTGAEAQDGRFYPLTFYRCPLTLLSNL